MTFGIITVKRNRLFRTERKNRFAFSTTGASSGPFVAGRTIIDLPRSDVDHELGGLAEVAGAFARPVRHAALPRPSVVRMS